MFRTKNKHEIAISRLFLRALQKKPSYMEREMRVEQFRHGQLAPDRLPMSIGDSLRLFPVCRASGKPFVFAV
jgi:hypothetical protein